MGWKERYRKTFYFRKGIWYMCTWCHPSSVAFAVSRMHFYYIYNPPSLLTQTKATDFTFVIPTLNANHTPKYRGEHASDSVELAIETSHLISGLEDQFLKGEVGHCVVYVQTVCVREKREAKRVRNRAEYSFNVGDIDHWE